ncbi:uncharacterized protein LOC135500971 [Lineus longissimus]|uniref:uncharacterized protein LOC135500971 n=1 Tax=Lineus longissimus TaxID=88925 RepID=UPI00315D083A
MVRRLKPEIRETYDRIKDQLFRDFVELVPDDNVKTGHYLPHHPVAKDSVTTPIRMVYDCSCKTGANPSLNDCLETGPPLLNDLASIMLRFRVHNIAISADIEKAFLNVGLESDDRPYTKFLWLSDPDDPESSFNVYQFKVVLFGASCSPFILNATIKHHLEINASDVANDITKNIYVDNLISGCPDDKITMDYYTEANKLMKSSGFHLREWSSNSQGLHDLARMITP